MGEQRATLLGRELGIRSLHDLLYYFPYKYIDRSRVFKVSELGGQLQHVQLLGEIRSFEEMGEGASRRLVAHFTDGTAFVDLVWFRGIKFVRNRLKLNTRYVVFGKPSVFNGRVNIAHPDVDDASLLKLDTMGLQPYYNTTEKMKRSGLNSLAMTKLVNNLFQLMEKEVAETLTSEIIAKHRLMPLATALRAIHFPKNNDRRKTPIKVTKNATSIEYSPSIPISVLTYFENFIEQYIPTTSPIKELSSNISPFLNPLYKNHAIGMANTISNQYIKLTYPPLQFWFTIPLSSL